MFAGIAGSFGDGQGPVANGSGASGEEKRFANGKGTHGVLPAISRRIRNLPSAIPQSPFPGQSDSPPMFLGLAALALLALSAIAILAYVIRFLRRPHASV